MRPYSQHRATYALFWASLKSLARTPSLLLFNLLLPLLALYGTHVIALPSPQYRLQIRNPEAISALILHSLAIHNAIRLSNAKDPEALLYLDTATQRFHLEYNITDTLGQRILYDALSLANRSYAKTAHPIVTECLATPEIPSTDAHLLQILTLILFMSSVLGVAFTTFHLKQNQVLKLIFATPLHPVNIIAAELLSRCVFILASVSIVIVAAAYALHIHLIEGLYTGSLLIMLSALACFTFMPYGFLISMLARALVAVPMMGNIVAIPQIVLSGIFFDIDLLPYGLQVLAKQMPLYHFYALMCAVGTSHFPAGVWMSVAYLLGWGSLGFFLSLRWFRWK